MGVPTSEVGYTSAMPRREDHEVHKDIGGKKYIYSKVSADAMYVLYNATFRRIHVTIFDVEKQ